tara:strand:- start:1785 stop:2684 length:900 start_codon:yes stop_codon:yes gene_type:complete
MKPKIFDTFLFFNELDLLEIRLNTLYDYVDYFVISECCETFSGKKKPLHYEINKARFEKFSNKIIHNIVRKVPKNFKNFKRNFFTDYNKSYSHKHNSRPLIKLSNSFQNEVFQRDSLITPILKKANDSDIILMSDLDEIPRPSMIGKAIEYIENCDLVHFKMKWYLYYINNFLDRDWFGTRVCKLKYLKKYSYDLLQYHKEDESKLSGGRIIKNGGWHFSFLGGEEKIIEKLNSYNYQGGRTAFLLKIIDKIFKNRIRNKIKKNQDIFLTNRHIMKVELDNSFPRYIQNNKHQYQHLIK